MIVAGIGCRRGCGAQEIVSLVRDALERAARAQAQLSALATASFKADEAGVRDAAEALGLPLLLVDETALKAAEPRCVTRSQAALTATGHSTIAEAAALAAAGEGGTLLLPRLASAGATCALAQRAAP